MRAREIKAIRVGDGCYVSFYTDDMATALTSAAVYKHAEISVTIERYKDPRSISANALFHVLCAKIAAATGKSITEVKRHIVNDYGVIARDNNGEYVGVMLPAGTDVLELYDYPVWIKDKVIDGKNWSCYMLMKRTSDLNTDEFSHLIDGAKFEAKELGIDIEEG